MQIIVPGKKRREVIVASIYFVGLYPPIMCGIADYTKYITDELTGNQWGVLSFDLHKVVTPLITDQSLTDHVWYGIPGGHQINPTIMH